MFKRLLTTRSLIGSALFLGFWGTAPVGLSCLDVAGLWHTENARYLSTNSELVRGEYVITATNSYLKELNGEVFGEWTRGSEFVTNVMHFFFQYHLNSAFNVTAKAEITHRESPWVKNLEISFQTRNVPRENLRAIIDLAKRNGIESASEYFYGSEGSAARQLVERITGRGSQLAATGKYRFAEGRDHLLPLTPEESRRLYQELTGKIPTAAEFADLWQAKYGIGIGIGDARLRLGRSADALKAIEALDLGYRVVMQVNAGMSEQAHLSIWKLNEQGGYEEVPPVHRAAIGIVTESWQVEFLTPETQP